MGVRGIKRAIKKVKDAAQREIASNAAHGRIAAGLSNEGYAGGYLAALSDVSEALEGRVNQNSRYAGAWRRGLYKESK